MTTFWDRVKTGSKAGFDKTWKALDKVGAPVNKLSNKLGSEAFWPTTLDKECDKAARILKSFCRDGFYAEEEYQLQDGPKQSQKVVKKIPAKVIQNAKGLAIFTTMRTGLWFSGAGGSGILIARKEDGSWSPPSGILLHTAGLGFMVGIDIYDCVVVINNEQALEAFYKIRCTLGSEISVAAGPVGAGGVLETELHKRQAPIFTYMKSRGFYAGVQIDGTVIIERADENERFYGQRIAVKDILGGKVRHPPFEVRRLLETIKAAQGAEFDETALPSEPPPGDYEIDDGQVFGVPDKEDPDPYGVLALEKAGMRVVEASTQERATWEQFSFNPSPTSPVHSIYNRNSVDHRRSMSRRSSWRGSLTSATPTTPTRPSSLRQSVDVPKKSTMVDTSTQTDLPAEPLSPTISGMRLAMPRRNSKASVTNSIQQQMQGVPENSILEVESSSREQPELSTSAEGAKASDRDTSAHGPVAVSHKIELSEDSTPGLGTIDVEAPKLSMDTATPPDEIKAMQQKLDIPPSHTLRPTGYTTPPSTPPLDKDVDSDHEDDEIVQPVMQSVQSVKPSAAQVVSKARLVTVAKRAPPRLPPRNPGRMAASPESRASQRSSHEIEPLTVSSDAPDSHNSEVHQSTDLAELSPGIHAEADHTTLRLEEIDSNNGSGKRFSTLSNTSNSSSTWDKVRALRSIEDDD